MIPETGRVPSVKAHGDAFALPSPMRRRRLLDAGPPCEELD